jgi:nucleotide-binding universal stress UspA family protein
MKDDNRPIVVGVDGSWYSTEALRWALAEGERRDCLVRALLVAHREQFIATGRPTMVGVGAMLATDPGPEYVRLLDKAIRAVLDDRDNPRLDAEVVPGSTADVLVAASENAQLLVLGSHGHGRLFEAVLGSVAQHCVRYANCPVVIIPAQLAATESTADEPSTPVAQPLTYGPGPIL